MNCEGKLKAIREIVSDEPVNEDLSVVVLHRGWIFIGELTQDGDSYTLSKCQNVRSWQSNGFGGLTQGAKSSGASLDDCQPLVFAEEAMIFCSPLPSGWRDA